MKSFFVALSVLIAVPAFANNTNDSIEIDGGRFIIRVGEEAAVPARDVKTINFERSSLETVPSETPSYIRFRAKKAGETQLTVRKESGAKVVYSVVVR
jgi:hypothetical protein